MTFEQDTAFEQEMAALLPHMRAFARVLVRHAEDADDLVQDAVVRMWNARERFEPGTNMRAWAFTIIRNRFFNTRTSRQGPVAIDDVPERLLSVPAMQERQAAGRDIRAALAALDPVLREVLVLTVGSAMTYEEVAEIMGCRVGTVKSRVFRARSELRALLDRQEPPHAGIDAAGSGAAAPAGKRPRRV